MQPQSDPAMETGLESEAMPVASPEPDLFPSGPEAAPEPEPPALSPGEVLRNAREARGESLVDVAQILKLSAQQLEALESGRFDVLPGPTFVRGFLRNYARYLGISPDPLLEGVSARTPTTADLTSMLKLDGNVQPAARPRPQGKAFPVALLILTALVLAGLAYAAIKLHWFDRVRFNSSAAASVSAPAHGKSVQYKQKIVTIQPPELALPDLVDTAPESSSDPPQMGEAEGDPATGTALALTEPGAAPIVPTLRLSFNASTLAQVRDSSGRLIFARTGAKGSTSSIKGTPPFQVMIKHAKNVELEFNGKEVDLKGHTTRDGVARLVLQ
jgi:cytoskeleton protein RodZ